MHLPRRGGGVEGIGHPPFDLLEGGCGVSTHHHRGHHPLPEPVVGLDGKPVAFDAEDPLVKALLPAFHEAGVPQAGLSKILQAYAATEVAAARAEQEQATAYVAAEQVKLGAGHKERTAALHSQVIAAIGAEPAAALRAQMRSADAVLALETLVSKLQGPAMSAAPAQTPATPDIATRLYG